MPCLYDSLYVIQASQRYTPWAISSCMLSTTAEKFPIIAQAFKYKDKTAVIDSVGKYTYEDLLNRSAEMAKTLQNEVGGG